MTDKWIGSNLKELRLSLGWSVAELARRLSCLSELICSWERSESAPNSEYIFQLEGLKILVDRNEQMISSRPKAEMLMNSKGLGQIHRDEVDES